MTSPSLCNPPPERQRADPAASGGLLPEGCLPATAATAEAHVCHQLHGDGQGDGRPTHLPALQGPADQGGLPAAATGEGLTDEMDSWRDDARLF